MTKTGDPQFEIPLSNRKAGKLILINARIFAAMVKLERPENAARARSRLNDTMLILSSSDLNLLTGWTHITPREKEVVSNIVNETARNVLSLRGTDRKEK